MVFNVSTEELIKSDVKEVSTGFIRLKFQREAAESQSLNSIALRV
jgi:hypothetical protein